MGAGAHIPRFRHGRGLCGAVAAVQSRGSDEIKDVADLAGTAPECEDVMLNDDLVINGARLLAACSLASSCGCRLRYEQSTWTAGLLIPFDCGRGKLGALPRSSSAPTTTTTTSSLRQPSSIAASMRCRLRLSTCTRSEIWSDRTSSRCPLEVQHKRLQTHCEHKTSSQQQQLGAKCLVCVCVCVWCAL